MFFKNLSKCQCISVGKYFFFLKYKSLLNVLSVLIDA